MSKATVTRSRRTRKRLAPIIRIGLQANTAWQDADGHIVRFLGVATELPSGRELAFFWDGGRGLARSLRGFLAKFTRVNDQAAPE